MANIGDLVVHLDANTAGLERGMKRGRNQLDNMNDGMERTVSTAKRLTGALAALGAGAGLAGLARGTYDAVSGSQKLQASLKTVTGSVEAASVAWENLLEFAKETPFSIDQSVTAFIRMKSLGLDPTESALRSFGNTASAMGKNMMQMVEAVADATTGEFERLKEFGIRASKEGEQITFTFQGVETTVANTSQAIVEYLEGLGSTQFAGAMSEQMDTLGGKMSNLQDSVYQLYLAFGEAGATNLFISSIESAANSVERLTEAVESGAFDGMVNSLVNANEQGNAFVSEINSIISEAMRMKDEVTAGLLDIKAGLIDMQASGVEAFAGLAAGAAETINKGLIPIQEALNYLDITFAGLLENVGKLLGPAGGNFIEQAEAIRESLSDPQGIVVSSIENNAEALRDQAEAAREAADAMRSGGENVVDMGFKPLTDWLFKLSDAASETHDKLVPTKEQAGLLGDKLKPANQALDGATSSVDRFSNAATSAANRMANIDWGKGALGTISGMVPEETIPGTPRKTGMLSTRQRLERQRDLSAYALEPNPNAKPTWSTDAYDAVSQKYDAYGSSSSRSANTAMQTTDRSSGKNLGTLTLKNDDGGSIDVQANDDKLSKWLADTLSGTAASA